MLKIERLHMTLPATYTAQAHAIADRVGQLLAEVDHRPMKNHKRITVPTLQVQPGAGVDNVALLIANGIKNALGGGK